MKPPSPLLGFNNNVRHKGRVFHIQTEDSGVRHPHIITHLFADGGRILKTTKTSYAEFIDAANMGEVVRQMMQDQHKAMFMALRDGQFDHLVEELPARGGSGKPATQASTGTSGAPPTITSGASATPTTSGAQSSGPRSVREPPMGPPPIPLVNPLAATQPMQVPPAAMLGRTTTPLVTPPTATFPRPVEAPKVVPAAAVVVPPPPAVATTLPAGAPPMPNAKVAPPPLPPLPAVTSFPSVPPADPAQPPIMGHGHATRPTPPRGASARPRLDIDPAAIHRAPEPHSPSMSGTLASVVEASVEASPGIDIGTLERAAAEAETPLFQQIRDLPPPPTSVLTSRPPAASPGGYSSVSAPAPPPSAAPSSARGGRYAPSRPSSIFAAVRPAEGASIFGEDLISEKSLDEVILSYLAEDLDGPGEKK